MLINNLVVQLWFADVLKFILWHFADLSSSVFYENYGYVLTMSKHKTLRIFGEETIVSFSDV